MITLYVKTGCPFCAKAIAALDATGVSYEKKNIADPAIVAELEAAGGKRQVPYMDDDNATPRFVDDDVDMYESDAIVAYVQETYGSTAPEHNKVPSARLHMGPAACTCTSQIE